MRLTFISSLDSAESFLAIKYAWCATDKIIWLCDPEGVRVLAVSLHIPWFLALDRVKQFSH